MSKKRFSYRGYSVHYNPKPIPQGPDWDFVHDDYDGKGDQRCGSGYDGFDCIAQINEIEDELEACTPEETAVNS